MTKEEANVFAQYSFIEAFKAGNENLIDRYFHEDLEFYNHTIAKSFTLTQIKLAAAEVRKNYQDLTSELKEIIVEDNQITFRVEQRAFFVPEQEYLTMDVMNFYILVNGKVKTWRLWDHGYVKI